VAIAFATTRRARTMSEQKGKVEGGCWA